MSSQLKRDYDSGLTISEVAKRNGITYWVTRRQLQDEGAHFRGRRPANFYDSPEIQARICSLYLSGKTVHQVAGAVDGHRNGVRRVLHSNGIVPDIGSRRKGPDHHAYAGGRSMDGSGYVRVLPDPKDPIGISMSSTNGYVAEHRLHMAHALGRPLTRQEQVHHINGVRHDNRLENLQLRSRPHGAGVVLGCLDCGSHNIQALPLAQDDDSQNT